MATPAIIAAALLSLALRLDADDPTSKTVGEKVTFGTEGIRMVCNLVHEERIFDRKTVTFDCDEERACTTDDDCENGRHLGNLSFRSDGAVIVEAILVNPNSNP